MLNKMRNSLNHSYTSMSHVLLHSNLSAAEQTRLSWARRVESFEAVPKLYQPFFEPLLAAGRGFPYTLLAPSFEGFINPTIEKLVCVFDHEIVVLQRSANTFETQAYPLDGISYVQVKTVLLDSHIKISGVDPAGMPVSTTIRFNTVTDYLFRPILEKIRRTGAELRAIPPKPEPDQFRGWVRLSYKFMNYAQHSLLDDARVIQAILQPEIRTAVISILGKTAYRTLFPTHVSILTEREIILIREEARRIGKDRYGGIWDYIPLTKIVRVSLSAPDSTGWVLSIQMASGERIENLYGAAAQGEVREFVQQCQSRI